VTYELIPQPDSGYAEVRIDGRTVARIDTLLLSMLQSHVYVARKHGAPYELPYLEAVSRPGKGPQST